MVSLIAALTVLSPASLGWDLKNVSELPTRFNSTKGSVRIVLVLSPTLPTCLRGARIIRDEVLNDLIAQPIQTLVVWTPMLPSDSREAAYHASQMFDSLYVDQFWDPTHSVARQYGQMLELPAHRSLAWNVYVIHGRSDEWRAGPPAPAAWMHQLGRDERTLDGHGFLDLIGKELKRPLPRQRGGPAAGIGRLVKVDPHVGR